MGVDPSSQDFHQVREQLAGRTQVTGSHKTPMTSQEAGKSRSGEFVGRRGVLGGPTGKAWNFKIRAWKLGVTPGLHALRSRRVGGYRRKRQEMGEEAVRTWREGGRVKQRRRRRDRIGALTQPGAHPSLLGSLNSHLAAPSTRVACFRPRSQQPCMPGEALSPLSALFSFQEGSGSSGPWVGTFLGLAYCSQISRDSWWQSWHL